MAQTTLEAFRNHLLNLSRGADVYPFLTVVERYLQIAPSDHPLRAMAVGALVRKGLHSVAGDLAAACPDESPDGRELRRAAAGLRKLPSEILPSTCRRACFEGNLRALRQKGDGGADLADQLQEVWRSLEPGLTLHQASDGNILARLDLGGRRQWVPAALDFVHVVECLTDAQSWKGSLLSPFLLEGVGTGRLVPIVHEASRCTYLTHSTPMFIVEPDCRALALALNLYDWSGAIADERFFLLAGPDAWERWYELMVREETLDTPQEVTRIPRWPDQPVPAGEATLERVRAYRQQLVRGHRTMVEARYAGRCDVAAWARRFSTAGGSDPLRILGVTSRFTTVLRHSTCDLLGAFERAGMSTRLLIEEKDHHTIPDHGYLHATAEFRPDLVVVIDHHRHEYLDRMPLQVPWLCWIQDELEHLMRPDVGPKLGPLDFTMGFGLTQCVLRYGYPAERFMPCKMAVAPEKFGGVGDEPAGGFDCDVVYVSHHSQTPEGFHAGWRTVDGNGLGGLIDAFFEQHRELLSSTRFNAGYDLSRLLEETELRMGVRLEPVLRSRLLSLYVRPLVDRFLRHSTLAWVADWADATGRRLHIYGNGWEQHPRFGRYARGPLEPGEPFGRVVRRAAISLHLGLNPGLHPRVLETVAAGGFVLTRYTPSDFHDPANDIFWECIVSRGLDRPGRVAIAEFPRGYREGRERLAQCTNRAVGEYVEITEELLLEQRTRRQDDPRYHFADLALPGYAQLTFESPESFAERAGHFLGHPEDRARLAAGMRASVHELFTYDALVGRIVAFVTSGLQRQANAQRPVAAMSGAG